MKFLSPRPCPFHILLGKLQNRSITVEPDADIPEARFPQQLLAALHLFQRLLGDDRSRWDPCGKAGIGRLVPCEKPRFPA